MNIGNDETTLEVKRFLHLQRKSTSLARAEVTRHGSLTTENQDTCCKWSHFHSALIFLYYFENEGVLFDLTHIKYN